MLIARLIEDQVQGFAVANVNEAVALRKIGIKKDILSLNFCKNQFDLCKKYNIAVSISCKENFCLGLDYHIALDTGMNRSGVKFESDLMQILKEIPQKNLIGCYSHIYSTNGILTKNQVQKFDNFVSLIKDFNPNVCTHLFASSSFDCVNYFQTDFVRIGMKMYDNAIGVTSKVLQTKSVKAGESIGYDGEFVCKNNMKIAIVEGGYFDGVLRALTGQYVAINTDFCKVLGKISMDSFVVDISNTNAKVGDTVVIYDTDKLSFKNRSQLAKISEYELMTSLKGRFNNVYFN